MTGIKGKSGGKRPNAGRPATKFTLRAGQQVLIHTRCADGVTPGQLATVQLEGKSRNRTLFLKMDSETIVITL